MFQIFHPDERHTKNHTNYHTENPNGATSILLDDKSPIHMYIELSYSKEIICTTRQYYNFMERTYFSINKCCSQEEKSCNNYSDNISN